MSTASGPGVLELVLRALSDKPSALADLDRLVQRLRSTDEGQRVLPEGFEDLWAVVRQARSVLMGEPS